MYQREDFWLQEALGSFMVLISKLFTQSKEVLAEKNKQYNIL